MNKNKPPPIYISQKDMSGLTKTYSAVQLSEGKNPKKPWRYWRDSTEYLCTGSSSSGRNGTTKAWAWRLMKGEHQVRIPEWETNESLKKKYGYTFKHGKTSWTFVEEVEFRNFEHPEFGCLNEDELLIAEATLLNTICGYGEGIVNE
jgi:hypothetical protein